MRGFRGTALSVGIATGKIFYLKSDEGFRAGEKIGDVSAELSRLDTAFQKAKERYEKLTAQVQAGSAPQGFQSSQPKQILRSHLTILSDPVFREQIERKIKDDALPAETAITLTARDMTALLKRTGDPLLSARTEDVSDVAATLLSALGQSLLQAEPEEPYLLAAETLTPAALLGLTRSKLLGILTKETALHAHTAILARIFELPALTGIPVEPTWDSHTGVLDSDTKRFFLEPNEETLASARTKAETLRREREALSAYVCVPSRTKAGQSIPIYANISSPADLPAVLSCGAEGIGLFRSEFLYLGKETLPSEEEQCAAYKEVLTALDGKEVVIRTFDLGGEKLLPALPKPSEANPALGLRGIRLALVHPELFKVQLRALLSASPCGKLSILYPMITTVEEFLAAKRLTAEARDELTGRGIPVADDIQQGAMIETPAAVEFVPELAKEADFLCVGTNDLTQYTYAIDRTAPVLPDAALSYPEAVFRQIARVTAAAHREKKKVRVCGELAANTDLTEKFLSLGIDGFSVSPYAILPLRRELMET